MQINNNANQIKQQYFTGINIAKSTNYINNIETNIDLFEITKKDKTFLNKLKNSVKMDELMPNSKISKPGFDRWQEMLDFAIDKAKNPDRKCFIAAKDNKPCGIITFHPGKNKYYLDYICTWPIKAGEKVPLADQTLFKQMFTDFLNSKANILDLTAILNGPFDTVSKYSKLGFKQIGGENYLVAMRTTRETTEKTMEKLDAIINTTKSNNDDNINLLNILEL